MSRRRSSLVAAKSAALKDGQRSDYTEGLPIGKAAALLSVGECSVARARYLIDHGVGELVNRKGSGERSPGPESAPGQKTN